MKTTPSVSLKKFIIKIFKIHKKYRVQEVSSYLISFVLYMSAKLVSKIQLFLTKLYLKLKRHRKRN
jgi:hypothetical protein